MLKTTPLFLEILEQLYNVLVKSPAIKIFTLQTALHLISTLFEFISFPENLPLVIIICVFDFLLLVVQRPFRTIKM